MNIVALLLLAAGVAVWFWQSRDSSSSARLLNTNAVAPIARLDAHDPWERYAASRAEQRAKQEIPGSTSNVFERINSGDFDVALTAEQRAVYFQRHGTNAETLLAMQRVEDIKLAAQLFPDDPRVQFAALTRDVFPEARREWLDRFKQSAPDNAMADYLSAREYFREGNSEKALAEFTAAAAKPHFTDYSVSQIQNMEEAQLSAGRNVAEAKLAAASHLHVPQSKMLRDIADGLQTMYAQHAASGDVVAGEATARMISSFGQRLFADSESPIILNQYTGMRIESQLLKTLPPDSQPEWLNQTVQERLDEFKAFKKTGSDLLQEQERMIQRGDESQIIGFYDRLKLQGEWKALLWLQSQTAKR
ncbi:MAG TPA: hypothetical protein VK530_06750 [Candidatus Acidoferrum sp.]|nr:hypothetical protein [Candidatus Acidoferrum sp.]